MSTTGSGTAPKLYQRACEVLALDISNGAIKVGSRLTETGVAERFGISRAPARQSLMELERMGLIQKASSRGYDVLALANPAAVSTAPKAAANDDPKIHFLPSWELIYSEIEMEIVSRTTFASWRINEAILAKHYGVSRTVARDVVARLQQRGIVQKDDSARWFAPALTMQHIDELYELRWVLEPLALEKAVPNLPEGFLTRVRGNIETAINCHMPQVGSTLDRFEQELHVELLGYCGNSSLMRAISLPQSLLIAHHFLYPRTTDLFETEPFLPEHLEILTHIQDGNIAGAKDAMTAHLQISRERAMMRIQAVTHSMTPDELPYLDLMESL